MPHTKLELDTLLGLDTSLPYHGKYAIRLLCAFEDRNMLVVRAKEGAFQLDVSSLEWKKFKSPKTLVYYASLLNDTWLVESIICNPCICTAMFFADQFVHFLSATDLIRSGKSRKRKERAVSNLADSEGNIKKMKYTRI